MMIRGHVGQVHGVWAVSLAHPTPYVPSGGLSLSFMARVRAWPSAAQLVSAKTRGMATGGGYAGGGLGLSVAAHGGQQRTLSSWISCGRERAVASSVRFMPDDLWHHYFAVWGERELSVYVDGELRASVAHRVPHVGPALSGLSVGEVGLDAEISGIELWSGEGVPGDASPPHTIHHPDHAERDRIVRVSTAGDLSAAVRQAGSHVLVAPGAYNVGALRLAPRVTLEGEGETSVIRGKLATSSDNILKRVHVQGTMDQALTVLDDDDVSLLSVRVSGGKEGLDLEGVCRRVFLDQCVVDSSPKPMRVGQHAEVMAHGCAVGGGHLNASRVPSVVGRAVFEDCAFHLDHDDDTGSSAGQAAVHATTRLSLLRCAFDGGRSKPAIRVWAAAGAAVYAEDCTLNGMDADLRTLAPDLPLSCAAVRPPVVAW